MNEDVGSMIIRVLLFSFRLVFCVFRRRILLYVRAACVWPSSWTLLPTQITHTQQRAKFIQRGKILLPLSPDWHWMFCTVTNFDIFKLMCCYNFTQIYDDKKVLIKCFLFSHFCWNTTYISVVFPRSCFFLSQERNLVNLLSWLGSMWAAVEKQLYTLSSG